MAPLLSYPHNSLCNPGGTTGPPRLFGKHTKYWLPFREILIWLVWSGAWASGCFKSSKDNFDTQAGLRTTAPRIRKLACGGGRRKNSLLGEKRQKWKLDYAVATNNVQSQWLKRTKVFLFVFLVLLRYNRHTALCKFRVCSIMTDIHILC